MTKDYPVAYGSLRGAVEAVITCMRHPIAGENLAYYARQLERAIERAEAKAQIDTKTLDPLSP